MKPRPNNEIQGLPAFEQLEQRLLLSVYFETFESGYVDAADVADHADWGSIPIATGAMETYDDVGYPDGSSTWGLQTTVNAYGIRQRYIDSAKTSGEWELIALVELRANWTGAQIGIWNQGGLASHPYDYVWFSMHEDLGWAVEGYKNDEYHETGWTGGDFLNENDWFEMRLTYNIDTGDVKAYWRDVSEDGSGERPDWTYLGASTVSYANIDINGTYFGSTKNHATFDDVQFNQINPPVYFEDFESGYVDGADVANHADWGTIPIAAGAMETQDDVGYPDGSSTWGLQTTSDAYGMRQRYIDSSKTSGEWELIQLVELRGNWTSATMGIWNQGGGASHPYEYVWFSMHEDLGWAIEGYVNDEYHETGWTGGDFLTENDWFEMRLSYDIDNGDVEAYWRDVSEDGSGERPEWTYLGASTESYADIDINGTYFASTKNHATHDDVQFSEVIGAPSIEDQQLSNIDENSANSTVVGTVVASGSSLVYSITGGNTGNAFAINSPMT